MDFLIDGTSVRKKISYVMQLAVCRTCLTDGSGRMDQYIVD